MELNQEQKNKIASLIAKLHFDIDKLKLDKKAEMDAYNDLIKEKQKLQVRYIKSIAANTIDDELLSSIE